MKRIPESVQEVLTALEGAGYEAWCVGGCVRDLLLGRTPEDWDVTTSALPEETMAVFGNRALPTGLRHGTVTVQIAGGHGVEVTTYRVDGNYQDHRRPEQVTFTRSLEEDLRRRDFTVNAIAMNLRGELRDPFGGREDLRNHILRCVGEPERRFEEDALRIMRGLRFAAVLGFDIEPETSAGLHTHRELLRDIAVERIQVELLKLLCGVRAAEVLRGYPDVIGVFWPEILPMVGFEQHNYHHCYDVWEHTLHALEHTPSEPVLRCAVLLHDIGKPKTFSIGADGCGHFYGHPQASRDIADEMLRRLKCGNEFRELVTQLVVWHDRIDYGEEKSMRRMLRTRTEQQMRWLLDIKRADNLGQAPEYWSRQKEVDAAEALLDRLLAEDACFSLKQLAVNGRDLMERGMSGPPIGAALEALLEQVVDGNLPNERTALLDYLDENHIR